MGKKQRLGKSRAQKLARAQEHRQEYLAGLERKETVWDRFVKTQGGEYDHWGAPRSMGIVVDCTPLVEQASWMNETDYKKGSYDRKEILPLFDVESHNIGDDIPEYSLNIYARDVTLIWGDTAGEHDIVITLHVHLFDIVGELWVCWGDEFHYVGVFESEHLLKDGKYDVEVFDWSRAWKESEHEGQLCAIAFKVLQFLNMRNVELVEHKPNPKDSANYEREFGRPISTYHTLSITGKSKRYERGDDSDPTGVKQRAHIVRGHPRKVEGHPFIPDGTYWIPAHVRGDEERGWVHKDYVINTDS